ncbi:hypothetical protein AB0E08_13115 [Streptomyces sp. NPDC048281]|uniref:hypothetical protein n=1 Tax=Streptomyces sp. NPDC048281 TaxID=3154715 RepID=UPI0034297124
MAESGRAVVGAAEGRGGAPAAGRAGPSTPGNAVPVAGRAGPSTPGNAVPVADEAAGRG